MNRPKLQFGYAARGAQRMRRVAYGVAATLPLAVAAFSDTHSLASGNVARGLICGWAFGVSSCAAVLATLHHIQLTETGVLLGVPSGDKWLPIDDVLNLRVKHVGRLCFFSLVVRGIPCAFLGFMPGVPGSKDRLLRSAATMYRQHARQISIGPNDAIERPRIWFVGILLLFSMAAALTIFAPPYQFVRAIAFWFAGTLAHIHLFGLTTGRVLGFDGQAWYEDAPLEQLPRKEDARVPRALSQWALAIVRSQAKAESDTTPPADRTPAPQ